jgi:hypothetical protein
VRAHTLTQLLVAVTTLLALAFVVPACLAMRLNRGRLMRAERDVRAIAEAFDRSAGDRADVVRTARTFDVLAGPGTAPRAGDGVALLWQNGRTDTLATPAPDPWGHRYEVNIGALSNTNGEAAAVWVLSAGPDGIVDTPFIARASEARLRGDDIGVRIVSAASNRR